MKLNWTVLLPQLGWLPKAVKGCEGGLVPWNPTWDPCSHFRVFRTHWENSTIAYFWSFLSFSVNQNCQQPHGGVMSDTWNPSCNDLVLGNRGGQASFSPSSCSRQEPFHGLSILNRPCVVPSHAELMTDTDVRVIQVVFGNWESLSERNFFLIQYTFWSEEPLGAGKALRKQKHPSQEQDKNGGETTWGACLYSEPPRDSAMWVLTPLLWEKQVAGWDEILATWILSILRWKTLAETNVQATMMYPGSTPYPLHVASCCGIYLLDKSMLCRYERIKGMLVFRHVF